MVLSWFHYFELTAFALSVIFFSDLKRFKIGGYVAYLFLVCVTELTASNIEAFGLDNNHFIYNIYIVIATAISLYIYHQILGYKGTKRTVYLTLSVLAVLYITINMFFVQGFIDYDTYGNTVNTSVSIILPVLVLVKLFINDDIKIKLTDNPYFWICTGTLIFNLCDLLILGLQQFIQVKQIAVGGVMLYNIIMPIFAAFLYGCLCYSFILCRKLTTRLSQS